MKADSEREKEVYLPGKVVKARYGIGHTTLYDWTNKTDFPKPYKLGPRLSRWKLSELEAWEEKGRGGEGAA